jgi:hypothetical protein
MRPVGRCFRRRLFPLSHWTQVAPTVVQQALREQFEQWGLPERLRVDNGLPWGNASDLPPPLSLWCVGLGIGMIWNRPYTPTENAKVERANGTLYRWGEPEQCPDFAAWEAKLDWVAQVQREQYPAVGGQSRRAAYPALTERLRPYTVAGEAEQWDLERVATFLSQGLWPRQVSTSRQISLYGKAYSVGEAKPGEQVWVRYDAETGEWVMQGREGRELARHRADQITAERIRALQVSKPHASSQKARKRRNLPPSETVILYAA